jgi:hypothetical protein
LVLTVVFLHKSKAQQAFVFHKYSIWQIFPLGQMNKFAQGGLVHALESIYKQAFYWIATQLQRKISRIFHVSVAVNSSIIYCKGAFGYESIIQKYIYTQAPNCQATKFQ